MWIYLRLVSEMEWDWGRGGLVGLSPYPLETDVIYFQVNCVRAELNYRAPS